MCEAVGFATFKIQNNPQHLHTLLYYTSLINTQHCPWGEAKPKTSTPTCAAYSAFGVAIIGLQKTRSISPLACLYLYNTYRPQSSEKLMCRSVTCQPFLWAACLSNSYVHTGCNYKVDSSSWGQGKRTPQLLLKHNGVLHSHQCWRPLNHHQSVCTQAMWLQSQMEVQLFHLELTSSSFAWY